MSTSSFELFLKGLTPALVVGGWVVVYRLQALQARRKLLRETAEKVREAVADLLEAAVSFHTKEFDVEKKVAITLSLTHLEQRYELFPKIASGHGRYGWFRAVDPKRVTIDPKFLIELRRAITLEHFDEADAPLKQEAEQIQRITAAAVSFIAEIDRVIVAALD